MDCKIVLVLLSLVAAAFTPQKMCGATDNGVVAQTESVKILSVDGFDDEALTAYTPHSFRLSDNDVAIVSWQFSIIGADDVAREVCRSSENTFEVPVIADFGDFTPDSNGDMRGTIVCEYERAGEQQSISSDITLSYKPVIVEIRNIEKHPIADTGNFGLTFDVDYLGASGIMVFIEQEYNSGIVEQRINQASPAHVSIRSLVPIVYNWIDVTVSNRYGRVCETIELAPSYSGLTDVCVDREIVNVYNAQGTYVGTFESVEELSSQLSTGLYIIVQSGSPAKKIIIRR